MKPPPPRCPAPGCVTASTKPTATAASMAFPPARNTSMPAADACASVDPTMPWRACTGSREAPRGATGALTTSASSRAGVHRRVIDTGFPKAAFTLRTKVYQYNPAWAVTRRPAVRMSQAPPNTPPPAAPSVGEAAELLVTLFELGREVTSVLDLDELLEKIP